ncbi:uncharacterized protein LOC109606794 [Aethina tumida]|uniref:uncharacterized protein LOC109606794 n=1 Tax=Aethina tumida TaxID=116153 RepID=UPI0021493CAC|nr:uncharacterized protein LOC109606794 [Aethina tumida]
MDLLEPITKHISRITKLRISKPPEELNEKRKQHPYQRSSSPELKAVNPFDYFESRNNDPIYFKWCEYLSCPPTKIKLRGRRRPPPGIISGNLVPFVEPELLDVGQQTLEDVSEQCSIGKRVLSDLDDTFKNWLENADSDDKDCYNGLKKCHCKEAIKMIVKKNPRKHDSAEKNLDGRDTVDFVKSRTSNCYSAVKRVIDNKPDILRGID